MALNATTLSAAMRAALLSDAAIGAQDGAALTKFCDKLAQAIVAHIVAQGVVTSVTTCPAGAGAATGGIT